MLFIQHILRHLLMLVARRLYFLEEYYPLLLNGLKLVKYTLFLDTLQEVIRRLLCHLPSELFEFICTQKSSLTSYIVDSAVRHVPQSSDGIKLNFMSIFY